MTGVPPPSTPAPSTTPDDISFGAALGRLRRRARLTGKELGHRAGMSQAKISRIETGAATVDPDEVPALTRALKLTAEETRRLTELAQRGHNQMTDWRPTQYGSADRQREFAQLEATTREFRVFQPAVVVGLLQTSEYARAVLSQFQWLSAARIAESTIDVSEAVSARVQRHEVLAEPHRHFTFVLSEAVLSNRLCGPIEMLGQIDRIREVARQENVTVGIVPADAAWAIPPYHGFELLDDRCVLVDLINTTLVSRGRADIRLYREVFDALLEQATMDIDPILDRYFTDYLDALRADRGLD
jgi:transcriptional regulator with XRE-family HTH domain